MCVLIAVGLIGRLGSLFVGFLGHLFFFYIFLSDYRVDCDILLWLFPGIFSCIFFNKLSAWKQI